MTEKLRSDLRYAVRQLRKSLGFAVVTVVTLALGIGASTAVFSLVNGVLLRPLPYAQAERLYTLLEQRSDENRLPSHPTFLDWRAQSDVFDGLSYIRGLTVSLKGPDGWEQLLAGYVSEDFFGTVGEPPLLGRAFLPAEQRPGGDQVAVISYDLWRRRFSQDPATLGRTVILGDAVVTIVGVMPPGFRYPEWASLWLPLPALQGSDKASLSQRGIHADSRVIGRLRADVPLSRAQGQLDAIATRLATSYPGDNEGWTRVLFYPLRQQVVGDVKPRLFVLMAAVALVFLIACANLVNLSLARGMSRSREFAVRIALGAGRGRLVRQLLTEHLPLAVCGGTLGWLLAVLAVSAVRRSAPDVLPRLEEVTVDATVLAFTVALSLTAAAAVGLLPALRATAPDIISSMKSGGQGTAIGTRKARLRSALVVSEIAAAFVLLVTAGLLIKSFSRLQAVDPGFDFRRLITLRIMPPSPRFNDPDRVVALYQRIAEAVGAVPGVESVALTNHAPLTGASMTTKVLLEGRTPTADRGETALFRTVSPGYFETMRIPLVRGGPFSGSDLTKSSASVLVNQTFVRRYWPGDDPIGKRITTFKSVQARADFGQPVDGVVVGVVGDVRHRGLESDLEPEVYLPYTVNPPRWIGLVLRTRSKPEPIIPALRRAVLAVDPDLPIVGSDIWSGFATMEQFLAQDIAPRKFHMDLLGSFAVTALVLALVGLYGVMSYLVIQRSREIALRLAVGAQQRDVLRLVLAPALGLTFIGIGFGVLGAVMLTRLMSSLLFGVEPGDPETFALVAVLLSGVALLASYTPAQRATRVNPMLLLRTE
jgi:putative ABC transport system permease protein